MLCSVLSFLPLTSSHAALDKDLLGDSDDEAPKPATSHPMEDKSAEIGNAQNQLASTTRSLTTAKTERAGVEQVLATQAAELSSLQTQLSSAKAAYETETRLLGTLRDRFAAQSTEIQKVKQELISAESDLSGMRVERAEIEGGLLRDKEEVRALHKRMKDVGTEMDMLKLEVEKARKDAKQQKGLLAIAKKQLSSREAERAKVEKELAEANQETAALTHEREAIEGELAKEMPVLAPAPQPPAASPPPAAMNGHADTVSIAAAQPLPLSPEPTGAQVSAYISPTNTGKSNNPFDRLAMGSSPSSSRTQSPFAIPFANATLPTPMSTVEPVADHTSTVEMDDPFGFSHPGSQEQTTPQSDLLAPTASAHFEGDPAPEIQATTPRAAPAELSLGTGPMTPHSPANTDFFQTPPSTAAQSEHVHSPERSMAPAELAAQAASREPRSVPGGFPGHEDIMSPVQEKEVDESDSEDEADDVPLATLTAKGKAKDLDSPDNVALPPQQASLPIREDAPSSFDDAFGDGVATPKMAATPAAIPSSNGVDAFHNAFSPAHVPPISPVAHSKTPLNGLNEFDEAMSKLTGQQTDTTALSFDTTFDDDFDFGAATEPSASAAPVTNATKSLPAQTQAMPPGSNANGFDDIFTSSAAPGPPGLPVASAQPPFSFDDAFSSSAQAPDTTAASGVTSSFEDAFGFTPAAPTNQTGTASSKMSAISQFQPPPGPHPKIATPSSPIRGSSSSSMTRSASPPSRTTSPPPRHQSPRPRASDSTSSIHEKPEKEKKNSRLSVSDTYACSSGSSADHTFRFVCLLGRRRRTRPLPCPHHLRSRRLWRNPQEEGLPRLRMTLTASSRSVPWASVASRRSMRLRPLIMTFRRR
jgi:epidermal growth factor receptor substrate 15